MCSRRRSEATGNTGLFLFLLPLMASSSCVGDPPAPRGLHSLGLPSLRGQCSPGLGPGLSLYPCPGLPSPWPCVPTTPPVTNSLLRYRLLRGHTVWPLACSLPGPLCLGSGGALCSSRGHLALLPQAPLPCPFPTQPPSGAQSPAPAHREQHGRPHLRLARLAHTQSSRIRVPCPSQCPNLSPAPRELAERTPRGPQPQ